VANVISPSPSA
jgi:hypothetical protein